MNPARMIFKNVAIFIVFFGPLFSFAAPLYQPGETLNPSCLPSNADCTVATTSSASIVSLPNLANIGSTTGTTTFLGGAVFNKNVGIGTSVGEAKLAVRGSVGGPSALFYGGSSLDSRSDSGSIKIGSDPSVQGVISMSTVSGNLYFDNTTDTASNGFVFRTRTSGNVFEALKIRGDGNVGIGTSTPYAKLSVVGEAVAENFTATSTTAISSFAGNVGIGTTTPAGKLEVRDGGSGYGSVDFLLTSSLYSASLRLRAWNNLSSGNGVNFDPQQNGGNFYFGNDNTLSKFIVQSGSVGIGTTSPYAKLSITSDSTASTTLALRPVSGQTANILDIFNTSGTLSSVISAGGNFGIGTSTPTTELQVASTLPELTITDTDAGTNAKHWFMENNAGALAFGTTSDILVKTSTRALTITNAGQVQIGQAGDGASRLVVTGGASGNAMITLNRPGLVQYSWALGGGGLSFTSDTAGFVTTSMFGDIGMNQLYVGLRALTAANSRPSVLSATSFGSTAGTDVPGVAFEIIGSRGTGAGIPGDIKFSTGLVTGSGTTAQSTTTRMTISGSTGNIGLGTTTPSARLSITQSGNTSAGGLWIAETGNTDFRSAYMDTSGILSFYGGDTAGALNTATLNAAGAWTNASDKSYKENIVNLGSKYGLTTVVSTQPRFYEMKGTHLPQVGFIAQELKELIPEVVDGKDGSMGISYGNLVAVAFQAIKELNTKVDNLIANGLTSVKSIFVKELHIEEKLCVDDVCIDKDQLKALLVKAGTEEKPKENKPDNEKPKEESHATTTTEAIATTTASSTPQSVPEEHASSTPVVKEPVANTTPEVIKEEPIKVEESKKEEPKPEPEKPKETPVANETQP